MTWEAFHSRGDVLRRVLDEVARRRDGQLPMALSGVRETFRDELDLLGALQLRWHTRLQGKIEHELAEQPLDLETAAISAWRAAADEIPGVREVLDHYAAHPVDDEMAHAMRTAVAKQRQTLAVVAGRVSSMDADEHGARIGAEIEAAARAGHVLPEPPASRDNVRLLDRLRAAMAAA
ncbi:MAG TPA: hypothetical protein VIR30_19230 [Nocardioides sp.]